MLAVAGCLRVAASSSCLLRVCVCELGCERMRNEDTVGGSGSPAPCISEDFGRLWQCS